MTTPLRPRQEGVDKHREGDVRIGHGAVCLKAKGDGQLLADGGVRSPGKGVGNHARDKEQEYRKELQVCTEDGPPASLFLVLTGKDSLDDKLVCAPVPKTNYGGPEQSPVPGEFRILAASHEAGHGVSEVVYRLRAADVHHCVPASQFP